MRRPEPARLPGAKGMGGGFGAGRAIGRSNHQPPTTKNRHRAGTDARPFLTLNRHAIMCPIQMATPDRFPLPQVPESTRKPDWLKVRLPHGDGYERVKAIVKSTKLATVCE